jgi:glucose-1-phosphate cytidylyltransferase
MTVPRTPKSEMPVVILCGGLGTRLNEETERVPKPLVDIGGRPILWHIMKIYGHHGLSRFVLCLGYKSWEIKEYFLRYREHLCDLTLRLSNDHQPLFHNDLGDENWEVTCAETGLLTATGARLWRVRNYVRTDTFMFTYGDGIGTVDLDSLLDFHYEQGRIGTVTGVHPTSRYGEMKVLGPRAIEFNEKPTLAEGFVSGGFFVFQKEFFDYFNDDPNLFLEAEPLQKLARDGELAVYPHEGFWMGMDTYRDYMELNALWQNGNAPWKVWPEEADASVAAQSRHELVTSSLNRR